MRNLDDIIPPSRRRESGPLTNNFSNPQSPPRFPYATTAGIALIIALSFGAIYHFSTAKVEVTPDTVSAAVQSSFIAEQSSGDLPYEIITAQKIASRSVKSTGTRPVHSSASGSITIYNTQPKAQKLITNTRFATTGGLIFRVHAPITVPAGSPEKPGSVVAKVYADKAGDSYNVSPTSFTIPGFAGTAQESKVYAKSSAAMTGGASGDVPIIDLAVEEQARNALIQALGPELEASLKEQIPTGYLLLPGAATTTYTTLAAAPSSTTGMVDVREQGTITAVVFPNAALAKAIATSVSGLGYQNEPVTLLSASNLQLSAPALPAPNAPSFSFTLVGTASLVYTVDPMRIATTIAGKTRSAGEVALTNYPEIKRAVLILRPFWRQTFPQDPSAISITVVNP
jgi:hypothetical protein